MKLRETRLMLSLVISSAGALAQSEVTPAKRSTSTRLSQEIRTSLPVFDVAQAQPAPVASSTIGTPHDDGYEPLPDILQLPKMTIRERLQQKIDPDLMISREDLSKKQTLAYLDALEKDGQLNRLLNSFSIPLFSPPVAARARAYYEAKKVEQLSNTIGAIARVDPEGASTLIKELTNAVDRPSLGKK